MVRFLALLLLVGCQSKESKDPPTGLGLPAKPTAVAAPPAADKDTPRGLCQRGCTKLLGCAGVGAGELGPCIDACAEGSPQKAQIEQLEAMTCEQIIASAGAPGGSAPATGGTACTADCAGCVGDNSSCYAAAGGSHGIPCDPCCCAPGGPAPTWRTPD